MAVALQPLHEDQQKDSCQVSGVFCALDHWHPSQYTAETKISARRMVPILGRMGSSAVLGLGRVGRGLDPESVQSPISFPVTGQQQEHQIGPLRSEGEEQGQRKRQAVQSAGKPAGTLPSKAAAQNPAHSPFANLVQDLPPWPAADNSTSSLMPSVTPFTNAQALDTISQKKEVVSALKTAYPEASQIPADTKELISKLESDIEKLEKEYSKSTTKNLHAATTALGKAQKTLAETLESKKVHRSRWTKHVAEAAKTWEGQLHEYRQQQAEFQTIAAKGRADIETARQAIQTLSTKATPAALAAIPVLQPTSAETEDLTLDGDDEEETAQHQLQTVLQSCAASLGVSSLPVHPQQPLDEMDTEQPDASGAPQKRLRSMEPFGGGGGGGNVVAPPLDSKTL